MARNINLSYGLVSFAAKYDTAREARPETRNLCVGQPGHNAHDPQLLTSPKVCHECGTVTDFKALKKGIKEGSSYKVVDQADIAEAKKDTAELYKGKLELLPTPTQDFMGKTAAGKALYYLTPAAGSEDHYAMLARLVGDHPEVTLNGFHTSVSVQNLYALSVRDGILVMEERTREQALKPLPTVDGEVNEAMYSLLETLIPQMQTAYDPDRYEDQYALKLAQLAVDAPDAMTVTAGGASTSPTGKVPASDVGLMAQLQALADAAKAPQDA